MPSTKKRKNIPLQLPKGQLKASAVSDSCFLKMIVYKLIFGEILEKLNLIMQAQFSISSNITIYEKEKYVRKLMTFM